MRNYMHRSLHSAEETTLLFFRQHPAELPPRDAPSGTSSLISLSSPSHCHLQGAHHDLTHPEHLQAAVRLLPASQLDTPHATPVLPHTPSLAKTVALSQFYIQCIIPATLQDSGARRGWGKHLHFHKLPQ